VPRFLDGNGPITALARLLATFTLIAACLFAQDTRLAKTKEQVAEHLLGPSPTLRRQAVAWAKQNLDEVAPLVAKGLRERGSAAPFDAIRALGELKDDRISGALVAAASDPAFPWTPHALEALADQAAREAAGLFGNHVNSPVARSRAASCRGIGALDLRVMESLVSARLGDEEAAVRLEAAKTLWRFGDAAGIPVVIRDLSLDRRFSDADPGSVARDAAKGFLAEIGADPRLLPAGPASPTQLDDVLAMLRLKLGVIADKFPEKILPHEPDVGPEIRHAIEARSCFEGDFFLRCDAAGNVVLGRDLLRRYRVDEKLVAPIVRALEALDTGGKDRKILGPITCDFERLAIRGESAWRTLVIGTGKRDAGFDAFEAALADLIAATRGPEAAARHQRRVTPFRAAPATESAPATRAGATR
jgi:hypothetical protein